MKYAAFGLGGGGYTVLQEEELKGAVVVSWVIN